jgi:hypothetical protein
MTSTNSDVSTDKYVTPQEISDHDEELRLHREKLTLFVRPVDTLRLFIASSCSLTTYVVKSSVSHPAFLKLIVPLFCLWFLSKLVPGNLLIPVHETQSGST